MSTKEATTEEKNCDLSGIELLTEVKDNVATVTVSKDTYVKVAEDAGIDKVTLDKVAKFDKQYLKGMYDKIIDEAEGLYKKDKTIKELNSVITYGPETKDKLKVDVDFTRKVSTKFGSNDPKDKVLKPKVVMTVESDRYHLTKKAIKTSEDRLKDMIASV